MIYSFLYVLVFSIALVLIQKLDVSIPPLFSLIITSTIASLYFNIINKGHLKKIYSHCLENKKQWFSVMFIVLVMWATTMIGPGLIGASLFNFIYFAWLGMLGFMLLSFQNWKEYKIKFYFGLCLFLLIIANVFFELRTSFSYQALYGISMALIGGTASFIYFKQSQSLAKSADLSATQVLAVRFYLAIIILLLIVPKHQIQNYFTVINSVSLVLLAFFSLIIPLYFSQKALEKITSEQHAIINSACPIVTGILQEMIFNDLRIEQMFIYFLYTLAILSFYFINKFNQKLVFNR
ncbi:MAG: EamA family transporter [Gammaproteobacteria bacterium]|nr:EamA family transporter [Gammaproteobacteria bacterium]